MSDSTEKGSSFHSSAFWAFVIIGALVMFWPGLIAPFHFFEFWTIKGSFKDAVWSAWPVYAWGIGLNVLIFLGRGAPNINKSAGEVFVAGVGISAMAGVFEEMAFRWLLFFAAMVTIPWSDWLLLGFMGWHPLRWLYTDVLCPVANFFTLGYLKSYLMNGYGWAVGAAVISSNGSFRNGHSYQGFFGFVNSWFLGMYFHFVVFKTGLLAAITIHFLYDFFIFTTAAVAVAMADRRRWA